MYLVFVFAIQIMIVTFISTIETQKVLFKGFNPIKNILSSTYDSQKNLHAVVLTM